MKSTEFEWSCLAPILIPYHKHDIVFVFSCSQSARKRTIHQKGSPEVHDQSHSDSLLLIHDPFPQILLYSPTPIIIYINHTKITIKRVLIKIRISFLSYIPSNRSLYWNEGNWYYPYVYMLAFHLKYLRQERRPPFYLDGISLPIHWKRVRVSHF